ncbi:MAG: UdgX family uracil-DNA binding protein [Devosia sp.]
MHRVRLTSLNDFAEWRAAARGLLLKGAHPDEVVWEDPACSPDLFAPPEDRPPEVITRAVGTVPQKFLELADAAICHRELIRFGLLYRLLFRLQKDKELIDARSDPDISKLHRLASEIRRDSHKMKAFVRFREEGQRFGAWFEPDHYVLERTAPFFVRRFASMPWIIMTPYRSAAWNGEQLFFGDGTRKQDAPRDDAMEEVWKTYFASIFNPARLKVGMMKSEMPVKYWRNLPEAELIPPLIRGAKEAEEKMIARAGTQPPSRHVRAEARREVSSDEAQEIKTLADAQASVQGCTRCPLHEHATQAVFGEGPQTAEVMFVGEQPGNEEDLQGKPFIGPAGQVLQTALDKIGIDRRRVYVTNAVKHFKFEPRGKRRIHQKPNAGEVQACRFWLDLERAFVRPKLVVALGATAATSLTGKAASISSLRGRKLELPDGSNLWVTVHPSYLLRLPDREKAAEELARFEDDLRAVKAYIDRRHDGARNGGPAEGRAA